MSHLCGGATPSQAIPARDHTAQIVPVADMAHNMYIAIQTEIVTNLL